MHADDLAKLRQFQESADHLFEHSLLKSKGLRVKTTYSWNVEKGGSLGRHHIDPESLESLLLRIRIFTLRDDDIYFNRIANICSRNLPEGVSPEFVRNLKNRFQNKPSTGNLMVLGVNGEKYGEAQVLELVFYGESFHQKPGKRDTIKELREHFGDGVRDVLVSALIKMVDSIGYLRELAKQVEHGGDTKI